MAFVSSFAGVSLASPRTARTTLSASPRRAAVARPAPARMSLEPVATAVTMKASDAAVILSSSVADFGGYLGPAVGLLIIGIIIAVLTPPVKE